MHATLSILIVASLAGCKRHARVPAPAEPALTARAESAAPAADQPPPVEAAAATTESLRGRVAEKIDVAQYSYLRLQAKDGEVWAAVPKSAVKVGEEVVVSGAMWMENFKSPSLDRTWPRIAFGVLDGDAQPPSRNAGMFAAAARTAPSALPQAAPAGAKQAILAETELPPGHPPRAKPLEAGDVKVSKAAGPRGRTIADIYTQRTQLAEHSVAVRGKVVKATNGVLGKNWLHLRDGSGNGQSADLTVASTDTAPVGETVVFVGTVRLDRDLGAGYHYDVIVEDAKLQGH